MPLTLITGPANAAKAGEVLGRFRAVLDRAPLLVVPTAADVDHFQRELAAGGALVGGSVVPFGSLVRSIAEAAGVEGRPLGPVARERVVVAAVRDAGLRELGASAESRGFAAAAGALIAELGRAGVSPEAFRAALPGRVRELGALVAAYHARLDRLGRDDAERLAARAVAGLEAAPDRWPGRPVLLYGFDDLTPLQVRAIRALAARCEVTVALTWETGRAAFAARDRAAHALLPDADEHIALPARADHYAAPAREALHHLERHLFEDGAAPVGDPEGSSCSKPAASERRPSSSRPRSSTRCAPACRRSRSRWWCAPPTARARCSSASFTPISCRSCCGGRCRSGTRCSAGRCAACCAAHSAGARSPTCWRGSVRPACSTARSSPTGSRRGCAARAPATARRRGSGSRSATSRSTSSTAPPTPPPPARGLWPSASTVRSAACWPRRANAAPPCWTDPSGSTPARQPPPAAPSRSWSIPRCRPLPLPRPSTCLRRCR